MITLRRAINSDCNTIFGWRNHPKVRSHFFDPSELSLEEHQSWFADSLQRDDRIILIACEGDKPVGVLRFDLTDKSGAAAEIDIYLAPERQGMGLGRRILREGEKWVLRNTEIRLIEAKVKSNNEASLKMFRASGFNTTFIHLNKRT